jgi:hypothetical protein
MERASIPKSECLPLRCSLESEDCTKKDKRVSTTALRDPSSLDQRECLPLRERVRTGG